MAKARLREGHRVGPIEKDELGRYFTVCVCSELLRAATPEKLSQAVIEHLVERDPDGD